MVLLSTRVPIVVRSTGKSGDAGAVVLNTSAVVRGEVACIVSKPYLRVLIFMSCIPGMSYL